MDACFSVILLDEIAEVFMGIKVFSIDKDDVVDSVFVTGSTTYEYALNNFWPLINRFDAQRKLQNQSFYERLKRDIVKGCIIPPITLAIVDVDLNIINDSQHAIKYIEDNLSNGYVLDGMQRLNTLLSASEDESFDPLRPIFFNILISKSKDVLLYRMITLNNGQKPMSARHQIEVLTEQLFDFSELNTLEIQTEKERAERVVRGSFNLSDISKGYLAYFTDNLHNENTKIIAQKMDEIIAKKVMEFDIDSGSRIEFQKVLEVIDKFAVNDVSREWLKTQNNLIGFCVGIKDSFNYVSSLSAEDFGLYVRNFDVAFKSIDAAKVNLGKYRRELSCDFIKNLQKLSQFDELSLLSYFSARIAT